VVIESRRANFEMDGVWFARIGVTMVNGRQKTTSANHRVSHSSLKVNVDRVMNVEKGLL